MAPLRIIALLHIIVISQLGGVGFSQHYQMTGKIIDGDTQHPIDSAVVYVFGKGYLSYSYLVTDSSGFFRFDSLKSGRYNLHLMHGTYKTAKKMIAIKDSSVYRDLEMFHVDSSGVSVVDDIAYEDNFGGGNAFNFFNPGVTSSFKSSYSFEYIYSFKRKVTQYDQIGLDFIPIKFVWHKFDDDAPFATADFKNEKYFGYYISAFVYNRLIISKQRKTGHLGVFLDLGIGYELPLSFKYVYEPKSNTKVKTGNIHKMNEFTGIARVGFEAISIKASYRFTDILKGHYPEPPRLKLGIELIFPGTISSW